MKREKSENPASEKINPCVTVSIHKQRTYRENQKDIEVLKVLLMEAKKRVIHGYYKSNVTDLIHKIDSLENEIDINYNLDSLNLFPEWN